jgi:sugar phosphate isomerase/epimerase
MENFRKRQWGIGSFAIPHRIQAEGLRSSDLIRLASEVGATVVQVCDNVEWDDLSVPAGLGLELGMRGIGDHLWDAIAVCEKVGSPFLRIVIDQAGDEPTVAEAIERLKPFADQGVRLGIENHDRFVSEQWLELIEPLGAGIVLDTANSLGSLEGPNETLRLLGAHTICLHWKPVRAVRRANQLGFEILGCPSQDSPLDLKTWLNETRDASVIFEQWAPDLESETAWFKLGTNHLKTQITGL